MYPSILTNSFFFVNKLRQPIIFYAKLFQKSISLQGIAPTLFLKENTELFTEKEGRAKIFPKISRKFLRVLPKDINKACPEMYPLDTGCMGVSSAKPLLFNTLNVKLP